MNKSQKNILWHKETSYKDVPLVGGKNASLGEMISSFSSKKINVPDGFSFTVKAYWSFLEYNKINKKLEKIFKNFDSKSIKSLQMTGKKARSLFLSAKFPKELEKEIVSAYLELSKQYNQKNTIVAVRSSGVAEDAPTASFAGQFETFLNVKGKKALLAAIKKCLASAFNDRVIAYREEKNVPHLEFALSIGVQKMIRSDLATAGIMFTLDTETGFRDLVLINSIYGAGEMIVKGLITPDEFYVFKPTLGQGFKPIIRKNLGRKNKKYVFSKSGGLKSVPVIQAKQDAFSLSNKEILTLAKWGIEIEKHYKRPQDIEWAKDGKTGQLFIVQSRPETVHTPEKVTSYEEYKLKTSKKPVLTGIAVGNKVGQGKARIIHDFPKLSSFKKGEVLVTKMTDPDWLPAMRMASAIVTDEGSKTCFSGNTNILTSEGFLSIKDAIRICKKRDIKTLSLNKESLNLEWKLIKNGFERKASLIDICVSQTGRMKNNLLRTTPDHKFLTFSNRDLVSKKISRIIKNNEKILSLSKIPVSNGLSPQISNQMGYLLGAISSDGNSVYKKYKNFQAEVSFIQKDTSGKKEFIKKVRDYFKEEYNYDLRPVIKPASEGIIRGKKIRGEESKAWKCYKKNIVENFREAQKDLANILLRADKEFIYNFLAGVIDGDGTYHEPENRIHIFCSSDKKNLFELTSLACLRLGINFYVSPNRTIHNLTIVDHIEEIFNYTARVRGSFERVRFGTRFFAATQLLEDIIDRVNYKGRVKPYILNNLLIDSEKIRNNIIPMIRGSAENHRLTDIVDSSLKMLRVKLEKKIGNDYVYNIEVEDNHNYVVFTNRYTPVVVNNCHSAIVSRELSIPCIVGTEKATKVLKNGKDVTIDCTQGLSGQVFSGKIPFTVKKYNLKTIPKLKTKIMMNIGAPEIAFQSSLIPNDGVGLARQEFIIADKIRIHPLAFYHFKKLKNKKDKKIKSIILEIERITKENKDKKKYFVNELAEGIAQIGAAFYPKEVIVRLSDFRTNEYRNLVGGELFEGEEANPMMGFRGASRYLDKEFQPAFKMECLALKKVRDVFGLKNISIMVPFCRTVEEGKQVIDLMAKYGLKKSKDLRIHVMCEIPSNVVLAEDFLKIFDGMSIGSNDLTQLTLGLDRDNAKIAYVGDERNEAIKEMVSQVIKTCNKKKKYCGICGEAPSTYVDFAEFLIEQGIESISLNPGSIMKTILKISKGK